MDSTISLILSRHGETEENKLRIMQGQMPGHLSELGKQQAEQLADLLEEEEIDVIVSSDLTRSYDTAIWLPAAKDWSLSDTAAQEKWIGVSIPEKWPMKWISRICRKAWKAWRLYIKEPESFCNSCKTNFPGKRILAIGHGGFNRAIIVRIEKGSKRKS